MGHIPGGAASGTVQWKERQWMRNAAVGASKGTLWGIIGPWHLHPRVYPKHFQQLSSHVSVANTNKTTKQNYKVSGFQDQSLAGAPPSPSHTLWVFRAC